MIKKLPLFICILSTTLFNAQVMIEENFNNYTIGNVAIDNQGISNDKTGYYTTASQIADFQISAEHSNSHYLHLQTPDFGYNVMWNDDLHYKWPNRNSGNEVINVQFELFTGTGNTPSLNGIRINDINYITLAGLGYNHQNNSIFGFYGEEGSYKEYFLCTLNDNTWYRFSMSFNQATGEIIWLTPHSTVGVVSDNVNATVDELDYVALSKSTTRVTNTDFIGIDNIKLYANNDSFLNHKTIEKQSIATVYPNPTTGIINLVFDDTKQIETISIFDLKGAKVKTLYGMFTTIDVTDLPKGVYFVEIKTTSGNKEHIKFVRE